ncbi:MAG: beta-lactamase family protein [Ruminococcaceae bacterium]|nr:beta-lactamase family protein [Oscillospiraceae bacterium]
MSKFLDDFEKFIDAQPFSIIRASHVQGDGEIETLDYSGGNPCQNTYSVAKLFTATAIGMLWDAGKLQLDEKVCDILSDFVPETGMDVRWHETTVEDVLTHRAGLPGGFLDIDTTAVSIFGADFLHYLFTFPLAYEPKTESRYSDGAFYLLSRIVSAKTDEKLDDFLWKNMLWKLGFQEMAWSHCPKGYPMGATGLYIHSSDMVKLGMLYLNGGTYKGERFISEDWCRMATEKEFAVDWDETHTIYYKGGMFGQKLIIHPAANRVLALQAYGANSETVAKWVREYEE